MGDNITIPGAVDLHVHFREPGNNKAETIKSGSKAALLGGYVLVCDMPNNPGNPTWTRARLEEKQSIIKKTAFIPMATYAGSQPEEDNLAELAKMASSCIGLKLYGAATTGNHKDYAPEEFEKIVNTWHKGAPKKPILLHSGSDNLNEFINLIAKKHSHPLHVCHLSSVKQAKLVQNAKKQKLKVTSGVCPHHILKTSHDSLTQGWFSRMQPPLLDQGEAEELFTMLSSGNIDVMETDHAPHSLDSKWAAEKENPSGIHDPKHLTCFGVPGIEFALPLLFYQMQRGRITLDRIVEVTSAKPAEIIGISLSANTKVTWDMQNYRIGDAFPKGMSGSGWTPYLGMLATGKVKRVNLGGKKIYHTGTTVKAGSVVTSGETI